MLGQFNAIILDVVVVVVLLLVIAIGALKGIKHTLINFVLLVGSIALSFTSLTNIIKASIVELLASNITLGAGITEEVKLGIYLCYVFVASLLLTIVIYIILRLLKVLIFRLIKRNMIKNNKLPPTVKKGSRIAGAIVSLLLNGVLVVIGLSIFANPIIGGDKTIETSYVTKYVEDLDDMVLEKVTDETLVEEKVLIKLLCGDLLVKVDNSDAKAFNNLANLLNEGNLDIDSLDDVQKTVDLMHGLLSFVANYAIDDKGVEVDGFEKAVELTRNLLTKSINNINAIHQGQEPIEANNTLAVTNLLKKIGLEESANIFETIFVAK